MKTRNAIKHFGSQAEIARTLDIAESTVSRWGEVVPFKWALVLQEKTDDLLMVNINDYRNRKAS
jgi:hypothetical protein